MLELFEGTARTAVGLGAASHRQSGPGLAPISDPEAPSRPSVRESWTLTRVDVYVCYPYIVSMETSMSTTAAAARIDRIELRATREEKRLLAAAAAHERLDVTSFILRNVLPAARDIVDRSERIRLSERDAARVLELLENPPEPTAALLAAARRRAART